MAKKDERFEVGDLVRIIDKGAITASHDLTLFKKYKVTELGDKSDPFEEAAFFITDDAADRLGITWEEFGGIEKVVKYPVTKGDRIRITHDKDRTSYYHGFKEGEVVTVLFVNTSSITAENEEGKRQSIYYGDFEPEHMPKENDLDAAKRAAAELSDEERAQIARAYFESLDDAAQLDLINRLLTPEAAADDETEDADGLPEAVAPYRPKVGDRVKVTQDLYGHDYPIGQEYEITYDDGRDAIAYKLNGANEFTVGRWIGTREFELVEKVEDKKPHPKRRPTVGDTVRILSDESDHEYEIGSEHVIGKDDHDQLPYRMKGGDNYATEDEIEVVKYREE